MLVMISHSNWTFLTTSTTTQQANSSKKSTKKILTLNKYFKTQLFYNHYNKHLVTFIIEVLIHTTQVSDNKGSY